MKPISSYALGHIEQEDKAIEKVSGPASVKAYSILFAIVLLGLIQVPCFATFTRVQTHDWSGASESITGVGAGHILVLNVLTFSNDTTNVTDDKSDTWVHCVACKIFNTPLTEYIDTWYTLATAGGNTVISITSAASFSYEVVREFSYTGVSLAFDVGNAASGSAGSSTLSVTTANANELLVGAVFTDTGTVSTAPGSWANLTTSAASYNDGSANFEDAGAAGSKSASFTFTASGNWSETLIAFRDTIGGGGGASARLTLLGVN